MATVNFSVPEEVKARFNVAFAGRNKSQIIADLMLRAVDEEAVRKQRVNAIDALLGRRGRRPAASQSDVAKARKAGRP